MKPYHIATGIVYPSFRAASKALGILGLNEVSAPDQGFALAADEPKPEITASQVTTLADKPTENEDGSWVFKWTVRDKTPEELLADVPWQSYAEARLAVVQWINGLTSQIISLYPDAVQKRWAIEEEAARAVKAGTADAYQTQIVTEEGAAKGRTASEHADAIIVNADRFHGIADQVNKLFLATDQALSDASSPMEYPAIFAAAQAQAAPLAAAYGLEV